MSAREAILQRVRQANGKVSTAEDALAAWNALPRSYRCAAAGSPRDVPSLLEDRLRDYGAKVLRSGCREVGVSVHSLLTQRGMRRMLIPAGMPDKWLPEGFDFVLERAFTTMQLESFEGALTCATVAIAETGTVVLQGVPGQGRRAMSLVPDYHLCLLRVEDVVATVPEAFALLQATACLSTTFISGPSATADIEMTRIQGVHGPRVLDILLIESS